MIARLLLALAIALPFFAPMGVLAANPSEQLTDPALEARARELSKELRCLVCQNQSIDDSDAQLAKDLRVLVRERISEGDTNQEVLAYLTDRYGAFVRLRPPFNAATVILWVAPMVVVLIAIGTAFLYLRGRRASVAIPDAALSEAEEAEVAEILRGHEPR